MKNGKIRVTIDVFSGRDNPVVDFEGEQLQDVMERLASTRTMRRSESALPPIPTLGYRGLIVDQVGRPIKELPSAFRIADGKIIGPDFASEIADEAFEDFVCASVPRNFPIEDLRLEIERYVKILEFWRKWRWEDMYVWPIEEVCKCAPLYEPGWWNASSRQPYNNCYNYATNYRTDSYAQPGEAANAKYTALTCAAVKAAAVKDELVDSPSANDTCPDEGHLVALVVAPGWDYHWYRKGRNGLWSHKPGGTAVTNLDNSGNIIADPRTADRGSYTDFCTFMVVKHGHIKII